MQERLIGIDAGGTMTKAALFDVDGRELACERGPNHMLFPAPGHTERDPAQMWHATAQAIRALLDKTGTEPDRVAAVSTTGYGSGLYVVDRHGEPVRPGIVSTDSRAMELIAEWGRADLLDRTARRVQQRMWPGQSIALMGWLSQHEPEVVERTHSVLFCKDFLRFRLCGDMSTDPTDASIAGVMDVTTSAYVDNVFRDLDLEPWIKRMPPIASPVEVAGRVTPAAAKVTGLLAGTPVTRGVFDVTASSLASGMIDASQLGVVAGTFSINSTLHDGPRMSTLPFLQSPYPVGGWCLATEGAPTSASNFEWFCRNILDGEAARALGQGRSIYDVCNELIAGARDRDTDILFLPHLYGGPDGAPAGLLGMKATNGLADVLRAIYEGIVFAHRMDIEQLLSGPDAARPRLIRLAGGASRSDVWAQMFADGLGLPVEITAGGELGAQGVAICAAVAVGLYPDLETAIEKMVRVARRFEPAVHRTMLHDRKFARFRAVVRALGPLWSQA